MFVCSSETLILLVVAHCSVATGDRRQRARFMPENSVRHRVLSLALSYSHSRTVSWCFRRRAKPDLLALLAQSLASRCLAPDALSAHLLTPLVGAVICFGRPCAQCCLPNLPNTPRLAAVQTVPGRRRCQTPLTPPRLAAVQIL